MKNLKLAHKMLVLTVILMTSILVVAIVAVNRLERVNSQNRNLVDRTILKSKLTSDLQVHMLAALRTQKNSILSPDDEHSKEFAAMSRASMVVAHTIFDRLNGLILQDHVEAQVVAVEALGDALNAYEKVNEEVLGFSVQNTNVKARKLLAADVRRQANILAAYFQKWFAAVASKNPPNAAEVARLDAIYKLHTALLELIPAAAKHIEASDDDEMGALEKKMAEIQEQLQNGLSAAAGGDPTSQVEPLAAMADLKSALAELIKLSRANTNNRSVAITLSGSKVTADDCGKRIDEVDDLLSKEANAGRDLSEATYQSGIWGILSVAIAGILLGGLMAAIVTRSITRPVSELRNLAQAMARGDLRQRVPLHQKDEVGELSDATNALANALSQVVNEIQKVSDELAGSADGLSGVSTQLLSQSEQASLKATSVASASEELSTNISTMAAAAEEMSVNVASISSASEQMSINVGTISSAAEQTSTNVGVVSVAVGEISNSFADVLKDVREGSSIAGDASRMADSATETIQLLNRSGVEISKVTETIKMIALQTNLLALNATIEATSAGEAGKGFAVVAHEIKELANQSAKAAEDIARKIEGVQNNTRQAVEVIQNVSQIIKDINASAGRITMSVEKQTRAATMISQNVGEANKGVGDIARSIAEVAKAAGDMSRNVAETARGATDVSRNVAEAAKAAGGISSDIHGVSDASRSTNKSATMVNSSAELLDKIGKELRTLVGRFKLSTEDATAL